MPDTSEQTESQRAREVQRPTIVTMIVEDDDRVRDILTQWIQQAEGFTFAGAFSDVETALPEIARKKPHVVVVDINLPGLSGIECVRQTKPLLPDTQFVMLTVYADSHHIFDALTAGATGYLVKSASRKAVIGALREVHGGGSPMSSGIARKVIQLVQQRRPGLKASAELSKRENDVLALLAQGYLYKEIADTLGIGTPTVDTYIRRIYEKLHVHSRAQAVAVYTNLK